ncbi:MAG: alkaline phosphatase family protein, partial [bacterium]|nr:alkaline phosphatase family protein [bacterium]
MRVRKMSLLSKPVTLLAAVIAACGPGIDVSGAEKHALVIGVGGLRPDQMQLANTPHIDALAANGSSSLTAENTGTDWNGQ